MFIVNSMFIRQIWYLNHHMDLPLPYHVIASMIGLSITCVGVESLFISRIDIQWRIQVQSNSISLNSQKPRSPYSNIIIQISNKMSKTRLIALIGAQYSKIQVNIIRWKVVRQVDVQWRNWLLVRLVTGAKKRDFTRIKIRRVLFFGPNKCLKEFKSRVEVAPKRRFWSTVFSFRKWTKINFLDQNQLFRTKIAFWHVIIIFEAKIQWTKIAF